VHKQDVTAGLPATLICNKISFMGHVLHPVAAVTPSVSPYLPAGQFSHARSETDCLYLPNGDRSFTLQQCVCRTRQNFFGSAAYVIDRQAARVLLPHHLPLQTHIDIFMHFIGCRFSNFFLLDVDAVDFSGRLSTHELASDHSHRMFAAFKEQVKNMLLTSCY